MCLDADTDISDRSLCFGNGTVLIEWVFGARAAATGTPDESEFMFAPHWDGSELSNPMLKGESVIAPGNR
jgi:hypothetical protein